MYWPDTGTGVDTEPARKPVASAVRKYFTEGGAGVPPTVPGGDWFNAITNEVLNVLDAAGIDPSKADDDQLLLAIQWLASSAESLLRQQLAASGGSGLVGGQPVFVTSTDYAGGASTSSTNNDAAINAAIDAAIATDSYVYWPSVYEVQGNIPNFHAVRHDGPGGIKRGTDTFMVHPLEWHTNTLYSSPSASSSNDGLTANFPFSGNQAAFDVLQGTWSSAFCFGRWLLRLAAGVYPDKATFSKPLSNNNRFEVLGPSVSFGEPTAIIDGTTLPSSSVGMYFQGLRRVKVQDIWFRNYPGDNGQGLTAEGRVDLYTVNVHATNCGWCGLNQSVQGQLRVEAGRFANNRTGIRCYSGVTYTIGYNGSVNRTILENNTASGFLAQNNSAGHVDDVDVLNNPAGVYLVNQSRAHCLRTNFTGNNTAIISESSSTYIKNDVVFVGNTRDELTKAFSIPEAFVDEFTFNPTTKAMAFGLGRAGVNPSTGYEYSFSLSDTGSGMQLLAPANKIISFTFGSPSSATAGRVSYDLATDTMRFVTAGSNRLFLSATGLLPLPDNTIRLGAAANNRFTEVCAVNGAINTCDAREKTSPEAITDELLDVADAISIHMWQWLHAIAEKGEAGARIHFGPIAQEVRDVFLAHGINGQDFGLLCYDQWDDRFEPVVEVVSKTIMVFDTNSGEFKEEVVHEEVPTGEMVQTQVAGDRWGVRPTECLWLLAAASSRRAQRAESRISEIESRLNIAGL